jgi:hypothetical protein
MSKEQDDAAKAADGAAAKAAADKAAADAAAKAAAEKGTAAGVAIIMRCAMSGGDVKVEAGDEIIVDAAEAERLISLGAADLKVDAPAPRAAVDMRQTEQGA